MAVTMKDAVAELRARIAATQSERDSWRASGTQKKYLAAYFRCEALELELARLREEGLRFWQTRAEDP